MHRELTTANEPFRSDAPLGLYALTALVGSLLAADLWPLLAGWLKAQGIETLAWPRELYGYRFALIAAVVGGARVLFNSLESLFEGRIGADLALAVACLAAILIGKPLVAAEVVFIGLAGECLEAVTFARTQRALGKLAELFPHRVWVLRDSEEVRTLTADVIVGDRIVVKPGGRVPVDGIVTDGRSAVDASALTGESLPIDKGPGDEVLAGSIVPAGTLTIEAKKVGQQTVAGRVIALTAQALQDKAPLQRHADRLAKYFLPVVLGLALLTFAGNVFLLMSATPPPSLPKPSFGAAARVASYPTLAVLVVACPCALILATPAAVIAALGRLAGTGVLIKGGSALERLAGATAFAFDKTGTLTEGKLELGDVVGLHDASSDDVLAAAACAEQGSEHPLARLILAEARGRSLTLLPFESFVAHPGAGVTATAAGSTIVVGTRRLLEERGIALPPDAIAVLERLDASGQTSLLVAKDGALLGAIGARDRVRPEAAAVLADLRALGIAPVALLTGDRAAVANAVAAQLPLTEVHAELLPSDKAEWVAANSASGGRKPPDSERLEHESAGLHRPLANSPLAIAFVGDGINDAPALARAAVGIAIGTGTDIAAEAGDIVMMGEPLAPLPLLVRLSRETVRIIRQNIVVFAFGVNVFGIVLTGWLWPLFSPNAEWYESSPLAAVLYHQLGSLLVLLNSMRLLAFERTATSPTLLRLRRASQAAERWAERFSIDDLLHGLGHRWKSISAALLAALVLAWGSTSFAVIEVGEVGVVQRFGEVRADLGPGLHLRWPWPIETIARLRPDEVRTVEIGFRTQNGEQLRAQREAARRADADEGLTWGSAHSDDVRRLSDEAVMVTGDAELIEILATVRYRVREPRRYLFGTSDPDGVIRSAAESVLRELVAAGRFLEMLTTRRGPLEADALQRLERRIAELAPEGLGVTFDGFTLHDLHPPPEVVGSYHAVARAIQERDRAINEAEADALRTRRRADEEANRIVKRAESEAFARTEAAKADAAAFAAWVRARSQLGPEEEAALAAERQRRVAAGENPLLVDRDIDARRAQLLADRRLMIDTRLALLAAVEAFKGRDKVIIDGDGPGKRQLFLIDPDLLRLPSGPRPGEPKDP